MLASQPKLALFQWSRSRLKIQSLVIICTILQFSRRQLEREQGKNKMLLLKQKQLRMHDDDDVIWPAGDHVAEEAAAVTTLPNRLNLGSSFDSTSLNSSSSSGSHSSYYLAASLSPSLLALNGSRPGTAGRPATAGWSGVSDRQLQPAAKAPTPPLAENLDKVGGHIVVLKCF